MALFQRKNEEKYKNLTIIYLILVTIQEPERKQQRSWSLLINSATTTNGGKIQISQIQNFDNKSFYSLLQSNWNTSMVSCRCFCFYLSNNSFVIFEYYVCVWDSHTILALSIFTKYYAIISISKGSKTLFSSYL